MKIVHLDFGRRYESGSVEELWVSMSKYMNIMIIFCDFTSIRIQTEQIIENFFIVIVLNCEKTADWDPDGITEALCYWEISIWILKFVKIDNVCCRFTLSGYRRKEQNRKFVYWIFLLKQRAVDWTVDAKVKLLVLNSYDFEMRSVVFHNILDIFGLPGFYHRKHWWYL